MAELNLGKIRFTFKGTYSGGYNYEKDDVVYHDGSTWLMIAAGAQNVEPTPANSAYWSKMSQGSDLGAIQGLAAGDLVYFDGAEFTRVAAGTTGQALAKSLTTAAPEWRFAQPILQEHMWIDRIDRGGFGSGTFYYFGSGESEAPVITPLRNDSFIRAEVQIFGEPTSHNISGIMQYKIGDGTWTDFPRPYTGQNYHFQLAPYEYTGDYNSTPHQSYCSHGLQVTSTDPVYLRVGVYQNTMYINRAVSTTYESGVSFAILREINPEFGSITVR